MMRKFFRAGSRSEENVVPIPEGTSILCKQCHEIVGEFMAPMKDKWAKCWEFSKKITMDCIPKTDCQLCAIVIDGIPKAHSTEIKDLKKIKFAIRGSLNGKDPPYNMDFIYNPKSSRNSWEYHIKLWWYPEETRSNGAHNVLPSIDNDANWLLAKTWYEKCKTSHDCSSNAVRKPPTRLIQLMSDGSLRLKETPSFSGDVQYCTLSHCWGSIPIFKLLQSNHQSLLHNISFTSLTKTFQDVINVARKFEFEFIWIDSLCIIQDDLNDWSKEASAMADVYAGSQLNFAATGALNGDDGCFRQRDIKLVQPCKIYLTNAGSQNGTYQCVSSQHWMHGVEGSPLSHRAWVLQERILASRTLHFGSSQLFWECKDLLACETYPNGNKSLLDCHDALSEDTKYNLKQMKDPSTFWENAVTYYTLSYLTKESDKLVAISGIAKLVHSLTNDEYVAGLWRRNFERQLLWSTRHGRTQFPRVQPATEYRAPSWSWASIEGPINLYRQAYHSAEDLLCCSVEDLDVKLESSDPFGQVSSGRLRLKCEPMKMAYSCYGEDAKKIPERHLFVKGGAKKLDSISFDMYPPEKTPKHEVYLLFIVKTSDQKDGWRSLQGLILQPTGKRRGEFLRIGRFYIMSMHFHDDGSCSSVLNEPDILHADFYESVAEYEDPGKPKFIITLV